LKWTASRATVDRLSIYYRTLRLLSESGHTMISSAELGRYLSLTPDQIRSDFASFGQFGKKGVGYFVPDLISRIAMILGLHKRWNLVVIGIGHLGEALLSYKNFTSMGFRLRAGFDVSPDVVDKKINGVPIYHINELPVIAQKSPIHIGVIAVPEAEAQTVANLLIAVGTKGIWNFAPRRLNLPPTTHIVNEDISVGLSSLSYYVSEALSEQKESDKQMEIS